MRRIRAIARLTLVAAVLSLVAAVLVPLLAAPAAAAPNEQGAGLGRHDRELLAEARVNGDRTITLLIASRPGANSSVARGVEALGGRIDFRDDALGYLNAVVPIDRAEQAARVAGVQSADVDEIIPLDDPRPEGQTAPTPFPAPDAGTPRDNPYMPIAETGADAFMDTNPTWDGRGVTVGVLDSGVTLDHPALATTTTGAPKIVDWVTYTNPLTDGDPTWVITSPVTGPTFSSGGVVYTRGRLLPLRRVQRARPAPGWRSR